MPVLPRVDTNYPALILKADPLNHGALGIARSLGRLGVPVYAMVENAFAPLAASRFIRKVLVATSWPAERECFVNTMSAISEIIGRRTLLIALDDLSAISIAENATKLSQRFLFPQLPQYLPRQLANKASFDSLCAMIGVPSARSSVPRSIEDVLEFLEQTRFPILVKATQQWRLIDDKYSAILIYNREALFEIYERTYSEECPRIILQEYIQGEDWLYNGYCNSETNFYLGFTGKKLLNHPIGTGSSVQGISLQNEELCSHAERFLKAISYSGICDIDWRRDIRDGQYKIVDCNPRIGLNFEMFEDSGAIDVVRAQHLNLTGYTIERSPMIEGRLFTAEPLYLRSILKKRKNISTTAMLTRPVVLTRKLAWWRGDDPLPFFAMGIRLMLGAVMRRLIRVTNFVRRPLARSLRDHWKRKLHKFGRRKLI